MSQGSKIDDVSPQDAVGLHEKGAVLLDVREPDEWAAGHAAGATYVPLAGVSDAAARFADQEVLTVCRSGGRSTEVAETLAQPGAKVRNVAGGMTSWAAAGLPVVRDDGAPGAIV